MLALRGGCRISFNTYFPTVKGKILKHTLEHTYHRKISRKLFSAFLLTSLRGGYATKSDRSSTVKTS